MTKDAPTTAPTYTGPRTHCSIAKALDVVGTRSAMLLMREALFGTTRFDDFAVRVAMTEAVTSARLKELVAEGFLAREPYQEPGQRTRYEYVLTDKGRDLTPTLIALMQWGDEYLQPAGGPTQVVDANGRTVRVELRNDRGEKVEPGETRVRLSKDYRAS